MYIKIYFMRDEYTEIGNICIYMHIGAEFGPKPESATKAVCLRRCS